MAVRSGEAAPRASTAVLLHEWAHTLGAFHERAPECLVSPRYGTRESRFSAESAALVRLGLAHRDGRDPESRAESGKNRAATRTACEGAAAAAPEAPHPRRALGELAIAERRWGDAVLHFRCVIELDEGSGEAWTRLALAYQRLGDAAALGSLQARYEAWFGTALSSPKK